MWSTTQRVALCARLEVPGFIAAVLEILEELQLGDSWFILNYGGFSNLRFDSLGEMTVFVAAFLLFPHRKFRNLYFFPATIVCMKDGLCKRCLKGLWITLLIGYIFALLPSSSFLCDRKLIILFVSLPPASFFVVEDHVLHTTQGLVNRAYVDELWELALSKIVAALRTHSVRCTPNSLPWNGQSLFTRYPYESGYCWSWCKLIMSTYTTINHCLFAFFFLFSIEHIVNVYLKKLKGALFIFLCTDWLYLQKEDCRC